MQPRLLATAFALLCFAAATLAGAVAGNPVGTVLGRSLLVLVAAYLTGRVLETAAHAAVWTPAAPAAGDTDAADAADDADADADASAFTEPAAAAEPASAPVPRRRAA